MSKHAFDPQCPDCRPTLLGPGGPLSPDDPKMAIVNKLWDEQPRDIQEAFHAATVHSSQDPEVLAKNQVFIDLITRALAKLDGTWVEN